MKVRRIVAFIATLSLVSTMFLPMTSALALDDTAVPETEISVDEAEDIVSSLPEETDTPEKETMVQEEADNMKAESETVEEDAGISVEGNPETEATAESDMQSVLPNLMRTFIVKGFDNDEEERNCEVIGNAVKYVPYSFLLFNENYPTKTKEAEPETPVEDKIVEVPTGLKIDGKGSWGNYFGYMYTDNSFFIEGPEDMYAIGTDVGGHDYVLDYAEIEAAGNAGTTLVTDLAKKTPTEIIELMGGNYTIGTDLGDSYYLKNEDVFPNIGFYLETGDVFANTFEAGDDAAFVSKLENGDFSLRGIQVGISNDKYGIDQNVTNQITDTIQTTYTYTDCAKVLGEFSCKPHVGGWAGGDLGGASYSYSENGCDIVLIFEIEGYDAIWTALQSNPDAIASPEVMRSENPPLHAVLIYHHADAGDTTETGSTGNSKGILYRSEGEFEQYVNLWLNGQLLVRGEDYDAESGSTKITIYAQTFENKANMDGINTIAAEFRTTDVSALNTLNDTNTMHVTAQNFRIEKKKNSKPTTPSSNNNTNNSTSSTTTSSTDSSTDGPAPTRDQTPYWLYVTGVLVSLVGIGVSIRRFQKISK